MDAHRAGLSPETLAAIDRACEAAAEPPPLADWQIAALLGVIRRHPLPTTQPRRRTRAA